MLLDRLVLVLNASYEAINIVPAKRALTLVLGGKAVVEEVSASAIRTARLNLRLPSVIRLLSYRRIPRHNRALSRKGILLRDGNSCQYCQAVLPSRELTLDHVLPRSRGGASTWENLVACCFSCNNRKGSRTPQEAGLTLAKPPRQITIHARHRLLQGDQATWERYLFV